MKTDYEFVTSEDEVSRIAVDIRAAGRFVFDLEFVSESRYIPELSLLQLGWGEASSPSVAIIDCTKVIPESIFALVASDEIECIAHAAKQDLGLLGVRFQVQARAFWDTQIASAFIGVGDQIGYAKMVKQLCGVSLDKGAQFTAWLKRPLTDKQLTYAANDVRYLLACWDALHAMLDAKGRVAWVAEESVALAASAAALPAPADAYRQLRGYRQLKPSALGALRALAAWRQQTALSSNKPPSWLLPDKAMMDLCRAGAACERDLRRVRGVGDGTIRRYGAAILAAIADGCRNPIENASANIDVQLSQRGQIWASLIANVVQSRCVGAQVAPRFVGTRADAEALIRWFEADDDSRIPESEIPLLCGWRRELAGEAALAWLRGEAVIAVEPTGPAALTLVNGRHSGSAT